jgi:hypothetical protein
MLDVARNRPTPPSLADPPEWLTALDGYDLFRIRRQDNGWTAWPDGIDENTELPGGTWRVTVAMPVDLSLTQGAVDPLLLLVVLADASVSVEDKTQDLVSFCRQAGKSWTQIGQALGMTKQSAWERFSGEN